MKTLEQLAREAGGYFDNGIEEQWCFSPEDLARFRAACRAEALEEAAQRCEDIGDEYQEREGRRYAELRSDAEMGSKHCAAAIREMK